MFTAPNAAELRMELAERARLWASGRLHVESYGSPPVVIFAPDGDAHGNFFPAAYRAILARPAWHRRFDKLHAQARAIPSPVTVGLPDRRWRELDSAMSSDALLMNLFCTPGLFSSAALRSVLGIDAGAAEPEFGWKARVPLVSGRTDRTEVDMRFGSLLVEAKLTEADFQTREASIVETYRDLVEVFELERLPRAAIKTARRRRAEELAEEYSQEAEPVPDLATAPEAEEIGRQYRAALEARAWEETPAEPGYAHYQLIRNVLAAHATGSSFAVFLDARRPDLVEAWFQVMAAVRSADLRTRLKLMTWQELAALAHAELQQFLAEKYGIAAA